MQDCYDAAILLLINYLTEANPITQKDIFSPVVTVALFPIAKTQKQPKCPSVGEQVQKL